MFLQAHSLFLLVLRRYRPTFRKLCGKSSGKAFALWAHAAPFGNVTIIYNENLFVEQCCMYHTAEIFSTEVKFSPNLPVLSSECFNGKTVCYAYACLLNIFASIYLFYLEAFATT